MSTGERLMDKAWNAIFDKFGMAGHDFSKSVLDITANCMKKACRGFQETGAREPRILCTQTTREMRPRVFKEKGLFILPVKNGEYVIVKGEGYVDIPPIEEPLKTYVSKLDFDLQTSKIGNSEMQHLDYAHAIGMVKDFVGDESLVMTIRGRKYTPQFKFKAGGFDIEAKGVQTEVDSGYEGKKRVILVEAKNASTSNTIIRQLYYPYRQWRERMKKYAAKSTSVVFFERNSEGEYCFWEFAFEDEDDYNSIYLVKSLAYSM